MGKCEKCGNEYADAFKVTMQDRDYTFDCFECAISVLAPKCAHCKVQIIGHGHESFDKYFCCAHCANAAGVRGLKDHLRPEEDRRA